MGRTGSQSATPQPPSTHWKETLSTVSGQPEVEIEVSTMSACAVLSFPDPALHGERVLKSMLRDEDRQPLVVSRAYESRDLKPHMRKIVTTWMYEVTVEQRCEPEVFPLSVTYLDLAVSFLYVTKTRLQLMAAVCMFIASKFRDVRPMTAEVLVIYTDRSVSVDELLMCELLVLQALKWNIHYATPYDFIEQITIRLSDLFGSGNSEQMTAIRRHADTFIVVCITDLKFACCPPSLVACASLYVAVRGLLGATCWQTEQLALRLHEITSIDQECLRHWSDLIDQSWKAVLDNEETSNSSADDSADANETKSPSTPVDVFDVRLVD